MSGLSFIREVAQLPEAHRAVLVPLIAWQLSVEHPEAFVLEGDLLAAVTRFIEDLDPAQPGLADRLEQRLTAAGVSSALLQEIQVKGNLSPLGPTVFAPREPPKAGQAAGPLAQIAFRSTSWK